MRRAGLTSTLVASARALGGEGPWVPAARHCRARPVTPPPAAAAPCVERPSQAGRRCVRRPRDGAAGGSSWWAVATGKVAQARPPNPGGAVSHGAGGRDLIPKACG